MDTEKQDESWEAGTPVFHDVLATELAAMITKVADSADSPNPVVRAGNELVRLLLTDMDMLRAEYHRTLKRQCPKGPDVIAFYRAVTKQSFFETIKFLGVL
jgi:hypothetical protein